MAGLIELIQGLDNNSKQKLTELYLRSKFGNKYWNPARNTVSAGSGQNFQMSPTPTFNRQPQAQPQQEEPLPEFTPPQRNNQSTAGLEAEVMRLSELANRAGGVRQAGMQGRGGFASPAMTFLGGKGEKKLINQKAEKTKEILTAKEQELKYQRDMVDAKMKHIKQFKKVVADRIKPFMDKLIDSDPFNDDEAIKGLRKIQMEVTTSNDGDDMGIGKIIDSYAEDIKGKKEMQFKENQLKAITDYRDKMAEAAQTRANKPKYTADDLAKIQAQTAYYQAQADKLNNPQAKSQVSAVVSQINAITKVIAKEDAWDALPEEVQNQMTTIMKQGLDYLQSSGIQEQPQPQTSGSSAQMPPEDLSGKSDDEILQGLMNTIKGNAGK